MQLHRFMASTPHQQGPGPNAQVRRRRLPAAAGLLARPALRGRLARRPAVPHVVPQSPSPASPSRATTRLADTAPTRNRTLCTARRSHLKPTRTPTRASVGACFRASAAMSSLARAHSAVHVHAWALGASRVPPRAIEPRRSDRLFVSVAPVCRLEYPGSRRQVDRRVRRSACASAAPGCFISRLSSPSGS